MPARRPARAGPRCPPASFNIPLLAVGAGLCCPPAPASRPHPQDSASLQARRAADFSPRRQPWERIALLIMSLRRKAAEKDKTGGQQRPAPTEDLKMRAKTPAIGGFRHACTDSHGHTRTDAHRYNLTAEIRRLLRPESAMRFPTSDEPSLQGHVCGRDYSSHFTLHTSHFTLHPFPTSYPSNNFPHGLFASQSLTVLRPLYGYQMRS